jgi:hypothetical protein
VAQFARRARSVPPADARAGTSQRDVPTMRTVKRVFSGLCFISSLGIQCKQMVGIPAKKCQPRRWGWGASLAACPGGDEIFGENGFQRRGVCEQTHDPTIRVLVRTKRCQPIMISPCGFMPENERAQSTKRDKAAPGTGTGRAPFSENLVHPSSSGQLWPRRFKSSSSPSPVVRR